MNEREKEKEIMTIEEVMDLIAEERARQDEKWGSLDAKRQTVPGYMLILRKELQEAEDGWMKNRQGKHSSLSEILQVAATAVACIQQFGTEGNPL